MAGPILLIVAAIWVVAVAGVVAAILNLHVDGGIRFLLLVLALWGYSMLRELYELRKQLDRLKYWIRLTFITAHLRNEAENFPPAMDRLQEDLETENRQE